MKKGTLTPELLDGDLRLFVDFDGQQLDVRTNSVPVHDYLASTFQHMLVDRPTRVVATLRVFSSGSGLRIESASVVDLKVASLEEVLPLIKDEVHLQLMRARPDLLWLHAAAVERNGKAVILAGRTGNGKSTLSTGLVEHGWRLMSDDIAPLRMDADEVLPFPQTPSRRIYPGHQVEVGRVGEIAREKVSVPAEKSRVVNAPVQLVVFITYQAGSGAELILLTPGSGAFHILRSAFNLIDHKSAAVSRAAELAARIPMFALRYSDPAEAMEELRSLPLQ